MSDSSNGNVVKDLYRDLVSKYNKHAAVVQQYWRSFDQSQRTQCIKAGAADGLVLKHPLDQSMGNVYKIITEINLRDITNPQSDFLLDLLKYRATNNLLDQYMTGLNGGPGDHTFIKQMMDTRNLHLVSPNDNGFALFLDEEKYGQSFTVRREAPQVLAGLATAIQAGLCVPQELGELVLQRQLCMLQSLNLVIEDILEIGTRTRDRKKPSKKSTKATAAALSKLTIEEPAKSLSLSDLIGSAADQKYALQDYLTLLSTEPVVLTHAVNLCFFNRPELLPDEKGRILPAYTDKYISGAVLDAIHSAIKVLAIWDYLGRLLELLASQPATDKIYRPIILQEISNVCHLEYTRAQAYFKRNVQSATRAKWFKRIFNVYNKDGSPRVAMNGDPEVLTRSDPQLHYMLRLCQSETDALKAAGWMKKLSDLHHAHPSDREELEEREVDSLGELAIIVSFIQDLSPAISMPSLSRKKNQMFALRSQEFDTELNELKSKLDLRDFAVPIDNLLEPGVASETLTFLDHFIIENAGIKLGFLYQDLVQECLVEIERQCGLIKNRTEQKAQAETTNVSPPVPEPREKHMEQRKQKEKTRPSHSSAFEIVATPEEEGSLEEEEDSTTFKVRASTAKVFQRCLPKQRLVAV